MSTPCRRFQPNLQQKLKVSQLAGMSQEIKCFFPLALTYPDFFDNNLADENRVLKVVHGDLCWARAFYYQLLKIILEIQAEQQKPMDFGQVLISLGEQIIPKAQSQEQAQKAALSVAIIQKFIKFMSNNPELSFQAEINKNEEVDESLIMILEGIVKQGGYEDYTGEQKIKYLGEIFQLRMFQFDRGIKFEDSDTFIYIQSNTCMYIAFLALMTQFQEYEQEAKRNSSIEQIQPNPHSNHSVERMQSQNQRHLGEGEEIVTTSMAPMVEKLETMPSNQDSQPKQSPVDYLFSNKYGQTTPPAEPASGIYHFNNKPIGYQAGGLQNARSLEFTWGMKYETVQSQGNSSKVSKSIKGKQADTLVESQPEQKTKNGESVVERVALLRSSNQPDVDLFYKPVRIDQRSSLNSLQQKLNQKKDPLDVCNDSEKGTFYRKFTDTRILNLLAEPYRSKVKMLKNRFVGVRSSRKGVESKGF